MKHHMIKILSYLLHRMISKTKEYINNWNEANDKSINKQQSEGH